MSKNSLSPAASDLGLGMGDMLRQQVSESEDERRKRLLKQARAVEQSQSALGPATQTLFKGAGGYSV